MDSFDLTLIALVLLVGLGFLIFELRLRALRTHVLQFPGSLRFEAHEFSVQIQRTEKEVRVRCNNGNWQPSEVVAARLPARVGRVEYTFAALGFRVEVGEAVRQLPGQAAPILLGHCEIRMRGADDTRLTIQRIPKPVALAFENFAKQTRLWVEKLETRQRLESQEQLRKEAEQAQAEQDAKVVAAALTGKPATGPYSDADRNEITQAQISQWRKEAGFEGQNSQYQVDPKGVVIWFIDVATDGRIILHANKVTLHTHLRGAIFTVLGGEMEVSVRDAFWSEDAPTLKTFRVLRGTSLDERRAWKERLELIRDGMA